MSRYVVAPAMLLGNRRLLVGYDRPLDYFFAQLVNTKGECVRALDKLGGFGTIAELLEAVAPYAALSTQAVRQLQLDRSERVGNRHGVLLSDGSIEADAA